MIKIEKEVKIENEESSLSWDGNWSDATSEFSSNYTDDGQRAPGDGDKVIKAKRRSVKGGQKKKTKEEKLEESERQRLRRAAFSEEKKQRILELDRQRKAQKGETWKEKVRLAELAKEKDVLTEADKAIIEEVREHRLRNNERKRLSRAALSEERKQKILEKDREKKRLNRAALSEERKQKVLQKDREKKAKRMAPWNEKVRQAELAKEKDVFTDADKALIEEVDRVKSQKNMKRQTPLEKKLKEVKLLKEKTDLTEADKAVLEEFERLKFEKKMKVYLNKAAHNATLSEEEKLKQQRQAVVRIAAKRTRETPDERKLRLEKTRMKYKTKMASMTPEELEHYRAVCRKIQKRKQTYVPYAEWSEEKKQKMRAHLREKTKQETPEQRQARLARYKRNIEKKKDLKRLMEEGGASQEEAENLLKQLKPELFPPAASRGRPRSQVPRPYVPRPDWQGPKAGRPKTITDEEIEEFLTNRKKWEENVCVKWKPEVNDEIDRPTSSLPVGMQQSSNSCGSVDGGSFHSTSSCSTSETRNFKDVASSKPACIPVETESNIDDMPAFFFDECSPPSSPLPEMESNINEVPKTVDVESETDVLPDCASNLATNGRKKVDKRKRIILKANNSALDIRDDQEMLPSKTQVAPETGKSTPEFILQSKKFEDPIQNPADFSMDFNPTSPENSPISSPLPEAESEMKDVTQSVGIDTVETADCENSRSVKKKSKIKPKQYEPMEYRCEQCNKSYKHKKFYDIHMIEIHREPNGKSLICPVEGCSMVFAHPNTVRKHYQRAHMDNIKPKSSTLENKTKRKYNSPICHICGKTFTLSDSLHKHMKFVHPLDASASKANQICNFCGKCFKQKCTLDDHVRRIHQGMSNSCDLCGRNFQSAVKLWRHKVDSHGMKDLQPSAVGNIQVQLCTFCGEYIFRGMKAHVEKLHPEHLEEYVASASKEYNKTPRVRENDEFYCELCKKTVRRKSYRDLHNRINHPELIGGVLPETLPTCEICGEKACSEKKLAGHILNCHMRNIGITLRARRKENGDEEPLICQFCSANQEGRVIYRLHIITDHLQDLIAFVKTKVEEGSLLTNEQLTQIENQKRNKVAM